MDVWPGTKPDICADLCRLPLPDRTISHIYCGHVLEHLTPAGLLRAMCEFRRVLRPEGRLCVVGPDLDRAIAGDADPVLICAIRDGGDRWPGDRHLWESTEAVTLVAVQQMFPNARPVPITEVGDEWPLPFDVWWQFAIQGEA